MYAYDMICCIDSCAYLTGLKPRKDKGPEGESGKSSKQLSDREATTSEPTSTTTTATTKADIGGKSSHDARPRWSVAGIALTNSFDRFVLEPPRDHNLKMLW